MNPFVNFVYCTQLHGMVTLVVDLQAMSMIIKNDILGQLYSGGSRVLDWGGRISRWTSPPLPCPAWKRGSRGVTPEKFYVSTLPSFRVFLKQEKQFLVNSFLVTVQ